MKKLIIILSVLLALTACSNKTETKEKSEKQPEKVEKIDNKEDEVIKDEEESSETNNQNMDLILEEKLTELAGLTDNMNEIFSPIMTQASTGKGNLTLDELEPTFAAMLLCSDYVKNDMKIFSEDDKYRDIYIPLVDYSVGLLAAKLYIENSVKDGDMNQFLQGTNYYVEALKKFKSTLETYESL